MYYVVEFSNEEGGGISIIREKWLTEASEGKQRCMWPPQKYISKFNKCIDGSITVDGTWEIYSIKRVFYETESLTKARENAKQAEVDSEVNSDDTKCRQRKKTKKIYGSETSDDDNTSDDNNKIVVYPTPPATRLGLSQVAVSPGTSSESLTIKAREKAKQAKVDSEVNSDDTKCKQRKKTKKIYGSESSDDDTLDDNNKTVYPTPPATRLGLSEVAASPLASSGFSLSELDSTLTPNLEETPYSDTLAIIAKHMALIESDIKELQIGQNEMLQRLRASSATPIIENSLPAGMKVPCEDSEDLSKIESLIAIPENGKLLVTYLSLVGGNKIPVIIRRILEKLFTNNLAVLCNWTGKNEKLKLKDLKLINIIREAVRRNKIAEKATDAEIHEVISNWFRFTKDRNGGRESRRVKK